MSTDSVQRDMFTVAHGQPTPFLTRWSYSAADPFAIVLAFRNTADRWVEWLVARDLVAEALVAPVGLGDIRMGPRLVQGYRVVQIELRSPDGQAVLEVDRELLGAFVEATTALVAQGAESDVLDLDDEIAMLTRSWTE